MILEFNDNDKYEVLKLLESNGINYKDQSHRLYYMLIELEMEDMLDNEEKCDEENRISILSIKERQELNQYIIDSMMDYDYSYYDEFMRDCLYEWLDNEGRKK